VLARLGRARVDEELAVFACGSLAAGAFVLANTELCAEAVNARTRGAGIVFEGAVRAVVAGGAVTGVGAD